MRERTTITPQGVALDTMEGEANSTYASLKRYRGQKQNALN